MFQPIAAYEETSGAIEAFVEENVSGEAAAEGGDSVAASGDQDASAIGSQNASSERDNVDVTAASSAEPF